MVNTRTLLRQRSPMSQLVTAFIVLATLLANTGIIYYAGGTAGHFHAMTHFYYVPIVIAALVFGPLAGVMVALTAALLGGPLMPANVTSQIMQPLSEWLPRGFFFGLVGVTVGVLTAQLRTALTKERRQRDYLNILHQIDRAILADKDLKDILEELVEGVGSLYSADVCCVFLVDEADVRLDVQSVWIAPAVQHAGSGGSDGMMLPEQITRALAVAAKLMYSRQEPFTCSDLNEDCSEWSAPGLQHTRLRSLMAMPVGDGRRVAGALLIGYTHAHEFSAEEQADLEGVAQQIAIALSHARQREQLRRFGRETLAAFTEAVAHRDVTTGTHINRIVEYAAAIAERLDLSPAEVEMVRCGAQLHDIGKLAVPTETLRKPGFLGRREWYIMRQHPVIGSQILERISVLRGVAPLVRHHHERYDGKGYPAGLRGNEIPLGARIIAVADAFDAMISDRPYRAAISFKEAIDELLAGAGGQFDPEVVRAFLEVVELSGNSSTTNQTGGVTPFALDDKSAIPSVVPENGQGYMNME
ncbi:MAG: HD domain-containing protein [Chloroflexi bacterium]|nr:MAG: HD domain-containing protein [Chloroflexota bacterium]